MRSSAQAARSQGDLLRAKIDAGAAAKAAGDQRLAETEVALRVAVRGYFRAAGAQCRISERKADGEDLKAAAQGVDRFWRFGDDARPVLVGLSAPLVIAAADAALGGAVSGEAGAAPTAIDRAAATTLARKIARAISSYTDDIFEAAPRSGLLADVLPGEGPAAAWRISTIAVDPCGAGGALAAVVAQIDEDADGASTDAGTGLQALHRRFSALSVTARCIAGGFRRPLAEVLKLSPGDVVAVEWRSVGAATLTLCGRDFALGVLGAHDGRRALKLGPAPT